MVRRYFRTPWLLSLLILLTGCSSIANLSGESDAAGFEPTIELHTVELNDVPFFPQEAWQCGPAALATVISAAGRAVEPADLEPLLFIEDRKGTLQVELRGATRRLGLLSFAQEADITSLVHRLQAGHPVLVLQNLGLSWLPKWHYAVAVGFDASTKTVHLRSGRNPLRKTGLKEFSRTWMASSNWMMTVHPPGEIPPGMPLGDYLTEVSGLERSGQLDAALMAYQAGSAVWPESWLAAMGEGNAHYQLGDFKGAEHAYHRALARNPDHPAPSHNLAWALIRQQRHEEATVYARKAIELSDAAEYASALEHLQNAPQVESSL